MNKLISSIAGLITLLGGFHLYLNLSRKENISFEQSLKILKENFISQPIKTTLIILIILFASLIVVWLIHKLFNHIAFKEKIRETKIKSSIEDYNNRKIYKELLFDKFIDKSISFLKSRKKPWTRINSEFDRIIVRDICDKSFPDLGNWSKSETFDLTSEGIEFFDSANVSGFDLWVDEKNHWDVLFYGQKLKKGRYNKVQKAYCIDFIPYENILHVDWEHDEYFSCITILCLFKYKTNNCRHPFKEFRYYVDVQGILIKLNDTDRRNFKPFLWYMKYQLLLKPIRRLKRRIRNYKYSHQ